MTGLLPDKIERQVVEALFSDAERLNWESLSAGARSKQYELWMTDSRVGGQVSQFLSAQAARVWIKDGPMKEFSRALNGLGKHADLIAKPLPSAANLVLRALGPTWTLIEGSQSVKPLRVGVRDEATGEERIFSWGPAKDFKHLVWAAISGVSDPQDWTVCVVAPLVDLTPQNVKAAHSRIASRCNVRVVHISV